MQYPKAPIIEAVVELRLNQTLDEKQIEKIAAKFAADYPVAEKQVNLKIEVELGSGEVTRVPEWKGEKLSTNDQVDVVGIRSNAFACMRLAPYTGWKAFSERARAGWEKFVGVLGRPQVSRIGLRYINRIDIPAADKPVKLEEYLAIGPLLPELRWGPISNYVVQVVRPLLDDGCMVTINTGSMEAPLLSYRSILLDIDVAANELKLMRDDDIWALIERMRMHKNAIFEGCITDKARELFSR